jgi:hypothetical protein
MVGIEDIAEKLANLSIREIEILKFACTNNNQAVKDEIYS